MKSTGLLLALLLASCSAPRVKEFYMSAIDTEKKNVTCVIYKENQVLRSDGNEPILTPATLPLEFKKSGDESGYDSIKLRIRAVVVGADGKIRRGIREGEDSPFIEETRFLYPSDAKRQLFILRKNPNYSSPE